MANSIVDSVLSLLPQQMVESLAWNFHVTPAGVQNGISSSVTVLICGIAERTWDSSFMRRLFNLIHESDRCSVLSSFPNPGLSANTLLATDLGDEFTSMIFGSKQTAIENMVGRLSGLGAFAGRELMSLAAPLTLGVLEHQVHDLGLKASSFARHIESEASQTQGMLPVAINHLLASGFVPSTDVPWTTVLRRSTLVKEGVPLAGIIVLTLVAWSFSGWCDRVPQLATGPTMQSTPPAGALGEFITQKLPGGTELKIPRLGIEKELIDFIEDSSMPIAKATWFDFDRLAFATGAANLQSSSTEQLENIASILKAYPTVAVKISGDIESIGNREANLELSRHRAGNVVQELLRRGIDPSRIQAEGYGEEHPAVADNKTEEGRQTNRRISLLVTAK